MTFRKFQDPITNNYMKKLLFTFLLFLPFLVNAQDNGKGVFYTDTVRPQVIKFIDNTLQTTKGLMWADTTGTIAQKAWVTTRGFAVGSFSNYVPTSRTVTAGTGLSGGGDLSANRTLTSNISTGVAGGQTIYGGTNASDALTISSTTNATKGNIRLGSSATEYFNYASNTNITTIGNSSTGTNYTQFATNGFMTTAGTANYMYEIQTFAYNVYPIATTYNGITTSTSTGAVLNGQWLLQGFVGTPATTRNAFFFNVHVPPAYVAAGKIVVEYHYTVNNATTTNHTVFYVGVGSVSSGEDLITTPIWTRTEVPNPATVYYDQEKEVTITPTTGWAATDNMIIAIYRDPNDAADNHTATVYINTISVRFECNALGGIRP